MQSGYMTMISSLNNSQQPVYFSILVDESNDRGVEAKDLVILLRYFDMSSMRATTRFLDLPTANVGTAAAIFGKVNECLTSNLTPL